MGKFKHHFEALRSNLERLGYKVFAKTHFLNEFGLPQKRERALVIAVKKGLKLRSLEELWAGYSVNEEATTVRRAIGSLPLVEAGEIDSKDPLHVSPRFGTERNLKRLRLMTKDGASWSDLRDYPAAQEVLTPAMQRYIANGKFGSHPDVYGRLWWDRPAVTIKRECGHVGNGRYSHPEQNRLCTVREMAILQGFPKSYEFAGKSLTNKYRHIGDAVPPLISYQLAKVCEWILTGQKPSIESLILPETNITPEDILLDSQPKLLFG